MKKYSRISNTTVTYFFTSAKPLHLSKPSLRTLAFAARYKRVSCYSINCLLLHMVMLQNASVWKVFADRLNKWRTRILVQETHVGISFSSAKSWLYPVMVLLPMLRNNHRCSQVIAIKLIRMYRARL